MSKLKNFSAKKFKISQLFFVKNLPLFKKHSNLIVDALGSISNIGGLWTPLSNCFMVLHPCVILFLDERTDPEDVNVKFTRNLKNIIHDTIEEQRELLEEKSLFEPFGLGLVN